MFFSLTKFTVLTVGLISLSGIGNAINKVVSNSLESVESSEEEQVSEQKNKKPDLVTIFAQGGSSSCWVENKNVFPCESPNYSNLNLRDGKTRYFLRGKEKNVKSSKNSYKSQNGWQCSEAKEISEEGDSRWEVICERDAEYLKNNVRSHYSVYNTTRN